MWHALNTTSGSYSRGPEAFKYELLLLLVSMIWGSAFVAQQIGMEEGLGPMIFNRLHFTLGCLSLIPIGCFPMLLGVLMVQVVPMMGKMKDRSLANNSQDSYD